MADTWEVVEDPVTWEELGGAEVVSSWEVYGASDANSLGGYVFDSSVVPATKDVIAYNGTKIAFATLDASYVSDFSEAVDDRVASLVQDGNGISWAYDDALGTFTPTVALNPFSTTHLAEGSNLYYTDERVDDRVGALVQPAASGGLSWTYADAAGTLTPSLAIVNADVAAAAGIVASKIAGGTFAAGTYSFAGSVIDGSLTLDIGTGTFLVQNSSTMFALNGSTGQIGIGAAPETDVGVLLDTPERTISDNIEYDRFYVRDSGPLRVTPGTTSIRVTTARFDEPNIVMIGLGTGVVTTTATVYISGAATEGVSNYALLVGSGLTRFGGAVEAASTLDVVGAVTAASFVGPLTGTLQTASQPNVTTMTGLSITASQVSDFSEAADDRVATLIQNGTGISWAYVDAAGTLTPTITLAPFSTTNLAEGTNLYFTDERVDDRVAVLVQNGTGISWTYSDVGNTLTPTVSLAAFSTTNLAEGTNLYYTQARFDSAFTAKSTTNLSEGTNLYFTDERVDDRVASLLVAGDNVTLAYVDVANTLTISVVSVPWADITTTPTTLAGYGITDALPSAGGTITGNLTITGDLVVQGASVTLEASSLSVSDVIVEIARGNTGLAPYVGAKVERGATDSFWVWVEATGRWTSYTSTDNLATVQTLAPVQASAYYGDGANLTALNATQLTTGTIPDARVAAASVTQHQAALSIAASQITAATFGAGATYSFLGSTIVNLGTVSGATSITSSAFVGPLTGNASTATALATARAINGVAFDGTANVTVTAAAGTLTGATLAAGVTASSLTSVGTLTGLAVSPGVVGTTVATFTGTYAASGSVILTQWDRVGGAVGHAVKYDDAISRMVFGSTTAHDWHLMRGGTAVATVTASGIDAAIGAGTPNTGAFTTLAASGIISGVNLALVGTRLEEYTTDTDAGAVNINYYGYAGGATRFRNFVVYDGKGDVVLNAIGSTKLVTIAGTLTVSGVGHGFGGAPLAYQHTAFLGTFAPNSDGGGGVRIIPTITAVVNGTHHILRVGGTFTEAASGTHAMFAGAQFDAPTITGGVAALTEAATVLIGGAPTGATTNRALKVVAGESYFGGAVTAASTLAVTGAITATGGLNGTVGAGTPNTGAFTTLSASGTLTYTNTAAAVLSQALSGGANYQYSQYLNTSGGIAWGVEGSTGGVLLVGSTAYDAILRGKTGLSLSGNDGLTLHMRIASTGAVSIPGTLAVTGAITATGGINGTVGATTPAAVAATTLASTGAYEQTVASGSFAYVKLDQTGVAGWTVQNTATTGLFTITEAGVANWFTIAKTTGAVSIGGTLAVTGAITATGGLNGTVGATTPAAGAFTTLSASGNTINLGGGSNDLLRLFLNTAGGGPEFYSYNAGATDYEPLTFTAESHTFYYRTGVKTAAVGMTIASTGAANFTGDLSVATSKFTVASATGNVATAGTLTTSSGIASGDGIVSGGGQITLNAIGTTGQLAYVNFKAGGTQYALLSLSGQLMGTTDTDLVVYAETGKKIYLWPNGGTNGLAIDLAGAKLGGTAARATTAGTNALHIFDGTAPVGTLANGVSFYSAAGEAYAMDAAGNATLLSPHDSVTNEWIFKSKHTPTGKVLKIRTEALLEALIDAVGLDRSTFISEYMEA